RLALNSQSKSAHVERAPATDTIRGRCASGSTADRPTAALTATRAAAAGGRHGPRRGDPRWDDARWDDERLLPAQRIRALDDGRKLAAVRRCRRQRPSPVSGPAVHVDRRLERDSAVTSRGAK